MNTDSDNVITPAARASQCFAEIMEILEHHKCSIATQLGVKPVGSHPISEALIVSNWSVVPSENV